MAPKRKTQRKRTNSNVPAKGRLRDMADRLWSRAVRGEWGNICTICRSTRSLNSHHLIPRQHEATRYDLRNGCCLCARCHQFDFAVSPHQNAAGWLHWLKLSQNGRYNWYVATMEDGTFRAFDGKKDAAYYCDVIRGLREHVEDEDFERIVGVRFSRWLEENE